jgi:hypothetical protein
LEQEVKVVATLPGEIVDSNLHANFLYCLTRAGDHQLEVHRFCPETGESLRLAVLDTGAVDSSWLLCFNSRNLSEEFFSEQLGGSGEPLASQPFILGKEKRHIRLVLIVKKIFHLDQFCFVNQCCGSGLFIPDPTFFHPKSRIRIFLSRIHIKEFKNFNPKSSRKYDPGCSSRIRIFYPSRIPDPGVKKAPDPGSATLLSTTNYSRMSYSFHARSGRK